MKVATVFAGLASSRPHSSPVRASGSECFPEHHLCQKGFSLLEMLVAVALVAILVVLGTAAFQGAIRRSESAKCVSNLRQIGTATLAYASDNNGNFRGVTAGNWPFGDFRPASEKRGFGALFQQGYVTDYNVFYCPAQKAIPFGASNAEAWNNGLGYASYACLAGFTAFGNGIKHSELGDAFSPSLPLNSPSRLLAMDVCANPGVLNKGRQFFNHDMGKPSGGNLLFGDGSVRWRPFSEMEKRYSRSGFDFYW
jgi:prepilin-type N-terminal cleavage/methylation domain-containing protein